MFSLRKRKVNRAIMTPKRDVKKTSISSVSKQKSNRKFKFLNIQNVDIGKLRIDIVVILFCIIWAGLWYRAWYLQMIEGPRLSAKATRQHIATELVAGRRGIIYDRNGQVLARSVEAKSVYAKPKEIQDFLLMANTIGPILGIEPQKLYGDLSRTKRNFVWLKRKVDDSTAQLIRKAGIVGIGLTREYDRIYPFKHMAGQLLGFVGHDDKGLEGIEKSLEEKLGAISKRQVVQRDNRGRRFYLNEEGQSEPVGQDITLTIDMQLQFIAEEAIAKVSEENGAKWSGALIVDIPTGEILAWAQYPFFNPNLFNETPSQIYRNRLAADALEPGSTFKPLVMAIALQENKVTPDTLIDCEGGKWETKNAVIRDTSSHKMLTASQVIKYSSNIGMAKIGMSLGAPLFHKYLKSLGFGQGTQVPVNDSKGILRIPRDWGEVDVMSTSFGQSISVTGLQMAQSYLTLLNHGVFKPLKLVRENGLVEIPYERIFSDKTSREVIEMMRDVVEAGDGTGKKARIAGVEVAGKTGTAQKADNKTGTYGAKRFASFVGCLPAENPRYFIMVMVDEPTRNQYGGLVAAPAFKEIASRSLTYSGVLSEINMPANKNTETVNARVRGLKLSQLDVPYLKKSDVKEKNKNSMNLPGHLAKASDTVPDVKGKSVRNAVELFARAGIVPELKGNGSRVVKQSPPAGTNWPEDSDSSEYILWLSER